MYTSVFVYTTASVTSATRTRTHGFTGELLFVRSLKKGNDSALLAFV